MSEQPSPVKVPLPDEGWAKVQAEYQSWHPALQPHVERLLTEKGMLGAKPDLASPEPTQQIEHRPFHFETIDEATERIAKNLTFKPGEVNGKDEGLHVTQKKSEYNDDWTGWFVAEAPPGYRALNPDDPNDAHHYENMGNFIRGQKYLMEAIAKNEGRWWSKAPTEQLIDDKLREVYRVHEGQNNVDIFNCAVNDLTPEALTSIENALNAVANYTGGKIFERVKGIVIAENDHFQEDIAGYYNFSSSTLAINIHVLQDEDHRASLGRYAKYFPDGGTNWFELVLTHELGHAMDIHKVEEADEHHINKDAYWWSGFGGMTNDFSAFDDHFGWRNTIEEVEQENGGSISKNIRRMDEAEELECREYTPTGYARTHPKEDFAETFAIAVLNGDLSRLPQRQKLLQETIQKAHGISSIGPKKVSIESIQDINQIIKPITELSLRGYVKIEQPQA